MEKPVCSSCSKNAEYKCDEHVQEKYGYTHLCLDCLHAKEAENDICVYVEGLYCIVTLTEYYNTYHEER